MIPGKQYRRACALARFLVCAVHAALLCIAGSVWEGAQRLYPLPQSQSDWVGVLQFTGKHIFNSMREADWEQGRCRHWKHVMPRCSSSHLLSYLVRAHHRSKNHIFGGRAVTGSVGIGGFRVEVLSTSSLVHRLIEACVSWVDGLPQRV